MYEQVVIDTSRGEVHIGGLSVAISAADALSPGALRFDDGLVIRPITFGERLRVVRRAAFFTEPADRLAQMVLAAATVIHASISSKEMTRIVQEILALVLAGAEEEGPPFADAMLMLARSAHWTPEQVEQGEAATMDLIAQRLIPQAVDDGWTRIAFEPSGDASPAALRTRLALNLLGRLSEASRPIEAEAKRSSERIDASSGGSQVLGWPAGASPAELPMANSAGEEIAAATIPMDHGWQGANRDTLVTTPHREHSVSERPHRSVMDTAPLKARLLRADVRTSTRSRAESKIRADHPSEHVTRSVARFSSSPAASPIPKLSRSHPPAVHLEPAGPGGQGGDGTPAMLQGHLTGSMFPSIEPGTKVLLEWPQKWGEEFEPDTSRTRPVSDSLVDAFGIADALARILHEEADLRGLDP